MLDAVKEPDWCIASYVLEGRLMLKDTYGLGSRVIVLKEETRSPQGVRIGEPSELEGLDAYDMIVVRGCGVDRIRVRILVEIVEALLEVPRVFSTVAGGAYVGSRHPP